MKIIEPTGEPILLSTSFPSDKWAKHREGIVSIIVPVYNCEAYLDQCFQSILEQTYTRIELIIVDDGSTDGSWKLCEKYQNSDARVIVAHKENGGVSSARNMGLELATGEYLAFVDADDYVKPTMIEALLTTLTDNGVECAMCERMDFEGEKVRESFEFKETATTVSTEYACSGLCASLGRPFTSIPFYFVTDKLFKREIWRKISFDETLRHTEDLWALFEVFGKIDNVGLCHHTEYCYRMNRENSLTYNLDDTCESDSIVGKRMLGEAELRGYDTAPYIDTCVKHTLRRMRRAFRQKDRQEFYDIHREYKKLYSNARKNIYNAKLRIKALCIAIRILPPAVSYNLMVAINMFMEIS